MAKRLLGVDVLTAARQRILDSFDHSERAYISFSGGKDSSVMLHLVMDEAIKRGRKVGVLFVDLEAQYKHTIAHILRCYAMYAEYIDPYWVSLPLNLRNAVSQYEPQWMCWDPDKRKSWVREPPKIAITDESHWPWFHRGMEFEQLVPEFADWYADGHSTACFVGIRSQESLNRWRTIASSTKVRVNNWPWSTRVGTAGAWNAYPIYDWCTEDIWTWHAQNPEISRNDIYDLMYRAGLTIHQARICQPYGDDQRRGLWLYHLLEPETWARVVARVNGANHGALYAQERGNILGNNKVTRPEGHTWESFAELMLSSMPGTTAEHYRNKIEVFQRWWTCRGYADGIPDEADAKDEAAKKVPSWRRICKALLRNDYWCKGLSFTQHKDRSSYARYSAIMSRRRARWNGSSPQERWDAECLADGAGIAGRPTPQQLALLVALTGGSTPGHGWKAIAKFLGWGIGKTKKRARRADASAAIEALKESEATFRTEKHNNTPQNEQGQAVTGLPGESNGQPDW